MISNRPLLVFLCSLLLLQDCRTDQKVVAFYENERWGFKDATGKIIIPAVYKTYYTTNDPTFIPVRGDSAWGAISKTGDTLIPFQYTSVSDEYRDGMILVSRGNKFGYINRKNKVVIPLIYDTQFWFSKNVTAVKRDGKYGMINKKGETVIPFEYQELHTTFKNGLAGARKNNKWGMIDISNRVIIPFVYDGVDVMSEGLALVCGTNRKYGYINTNNDTVIPLIYDSPQYCYWDSAAFINGRAKVTSNRKSGIINTKGTVVIPLKYDCIYRFCDGFAAVRLEDNAPGPDKKFGYVDTTGKEYIMPYVNYNSYDWGITAVPALLPDMTDTLGYFIPKPPEVFMGVLFSPGPVDGVYISDSKAADTARTPPEPEKPVIPQKRWTMEKILNHSINAFLQEPQTYPELCNLKEVSVACGILMCGGNYGDFRYVNRSSWEYFKKETIYKIIGTENLREAAWNWMAPYYKKAMQQMHPFHKQTYKDIAVYMKNYMNTYNRRQTENYLKRDEARFAHYDRHGKYDPYRKLSAFVDRLIIMHKVIDEDDARKWINRMADDVAAW